LTWAGKLKCAAIITYYNVKLGWTRIADAPSEMEEGVLYVAVQAAICRIDNTRRYIWW
jgi:hypothetical protein